MSLISIPYLEGQNHWEDLLIIEQLPKNQLVERKFKVVVSC